MLVQTQDTDIQRFSSNSERTVKIGSRWPWRSRGARAASRPPSSPPPRPRSLNPRGVAGWYLKQRTAIGGQTQRCCLHFHRHFTPVITSDESWEDTTRRLRVHGALFKFSPMPFLPLSAHVYLSLFSHWGCAGPSLYPLAPPPFPFASPRHHLRSSPPPPFPGIFFPSSLPLTLSPCIPLSLPLSPCLAQWKHNDHRF